MAAEEGYLPIGAITDKVLDTTVVTQTDSTEAHRENVAISSPETLGNRAGVTSDAGVSDGHGFLQILAGGVQSAGNTSTTALGSSETFTGAGEQNGFPDVAVSCQTDADGTLFFDFSVDGTNWTTFPTSGFKVSADIHEFHTAVKLGRYFRVRLVNGSGAQSYLRLYVYYGQYRQGNAPLNQAVSQDADAQVTTALDPYLLIKFGLFTGYSMDSKFGQNPDIDAAEDIWQGGGDYTGFPTSGSAETITITSSAGATDAGLLVTVEGLDANYAVQSEEVTLNGSGVGVTTNTYWRCSRAYNSGSTEFTGTLTGTMTTTSAVVFFTIVPAAQQTQIAAFTVPDGYRMLIKRVYIGGARGNGTTTGDFSLKVREFGGVFRTKRNYTAGNNTDTSITYVGGQSVPAKADVKIRCDGVSSTNADFNAEFAYVLVQDA